ncbi:MAG TPA: hypothetical protein VGX03_07145 [Candidatus Binatia bacterium]|nr:hypothetical protein [Candidatus Binatia bacterium]
MKKPDAKRQRPGLQRGFESLLQDDDTAKVARVIQRLTGKVKPSDIDAEPSELPTTASPPLDEAPVLLQLTQAQITPVKNTAVKNTVVGITAATIEANYYKVPNDVSDLLASLQTPAEQAVYHRLFRLSYGYNQNVCRVGMHALAAATNIASKKTIAKALAGLVKKGHIAIVQEALNDVRGTWYQVFLPHEIARVRKLTGVKNTPVKSTAVEGSTVASAHIEKKSSAVENALVIQDFESIEKNTSDTKNTAVNCAPITTDLLQTLSLPILVDRFYHLLHQRPSQTKKERAIQQGQKLLNEGFTLEELHYAITWVTQKHPDTGSFDRIPFFIDQALKDQNASQQVAVIEHQLQAEITQRKAQEQRTKEADQQLEEVQASLSRETLEALRQEAAQRVAEEHGNVAFGQQTLIRLEMETLIRERYLIT